MFYDKNAILYCLPYFFIIGPQKSATTDLHLSISKHPKIVEPVMQESNWFNRRRFGKFKRYGRMPFSKYMDNFSQGFRQMLKSNDSCDDMPNTVIGDGTSTTLYYNSLWRFSEENYNKTEPEYLAAHFIKEILPDAKFIGVFRNPTDRLWSDYTYYARNKKRDATAADFHNKVSR